MNLPNKWTADLVGKDRAKSNQAAQHILNKPDLDAWKCLIDNSEYLFSYIKDKAGENLVNAVNSDNFNNIFLLMKNHTPDWDEYLAEALSKFSSEDLNTKILDILKSGTAEEKAYAAKYFSIVNFPDAAEALFQATKQDYEALKDNAAQALGILNDQNSYSYYIDLLNSEDDWIKVNAARFLSSFNNKNSVIHILEAMATSSMAEHLAGEAASLGDIYDLFDGDDKHAQSLAFEAFDNIISGIPEVWPISTFIDFKVYECLEKLIELAKNKTESKFSGRYAQLLLKAKLKVSLFTENSQYTFDEEKPILAELEEVSNLLLSEDKEFWNQQLKNLHQELTSDDIKRKLAAINLVSELELQDYVPNLLNIASNSDESEIILCETISVLGKLGHISSLQNSDDILLRINDPNLLAVAKNAIAISE